MISPPVEGLPYQSHRLEGAAAVVDVTGPINYTAGACDTYGFIRQRVACALADQAARFVVLRIHSPGGEVAGAFDTSRALRAMAADARKPLICFSEADMCSAAYALASAGVIVASESASVGSIGVMSAHAEYSRAENAAGLTWAILSSGSHKTDGNPHMPFSESAIAAMQGHVDANASLFFQLVSEQRGLPVDALEGLQGRILLGRQAQAAGLVDHVMSWDALMGMLADQRGAAIFTPPAALGAVGGAIEGQAMAKAEDDKKEEKKETDLSALVAEAEGDDPEKKARARKALRAYFSDDKDGDKDEGASAAKAEEADESDESRAAAAAQASGGLDATAMSLAQQVSAQAQEIAAMKAERARELAQAQAASLAAIKTSRPDLAKVFAGVPDLTLQQAQQLVAQIPAPTSLHVDPLPFAVRGDGNGNTHPMGAEDRASFERAFPRLASAQPAVERKGYQQIFRAGIPLVNSGAGK